MANRQQLEGKWNEIKGRLKEKWGMLTDDDLVRAEGNFEQLVGMVQRKTGRSKEEIEHFIDEVVGTASSMYSRATEVATEYASEAGEAVQQGYEQTAAAVSQGYQQAEQTVRRNPVESVVVAFGIGIVAGVVTGLLLRKA